jgi:hypothetical protein
MYHRQGDLPTKWAHPTVGLSMLLGKFGQLPQARYHHYYYCLIVLRNFLPNAVRVPSAWFLLGSRRAIDRTDLSRFSSVASFPVMVCLLLSYFYPWWVWEFGVHLIAFKFFKKIYFLQKNTLVWWRFFNLRQNKGICGATEDFLGFGIIPWDSLDYTRSKQTISHGRKNIMDTLAWRVLHWGY